MLVDPYKKIPGNQPKAIKRSRNKNQIQESSSDTEESSTDESIEIFLLNEKIQSTSPQKIKKKKKLTRKKCKIIDTINDYKLSLTEEELRNNAWLSDTEINVFLT